MSWKLAAMLSAVSIATGCADARTPAADPSSARATVTETTGAASRTADIAPAPAAATPRGGDRSFDRASAATAIGNALVQAAPCSKLGDATGKGRALLTFAPDGTVTAVDLDDAFDGTEVGTCIAGQLRNVSVPPFTPEGGAATLTVGKNFELAPPAAEK